VKLKMKPKLALILLPLVVLFSGCLTSEDPFYEEADVVVDDRLIGTYDEGTNSPSLWMVEKSLDYKGWYFVNFLSDERQPQCSIRFRGVLFQVGTNRFLDLYPLLKACDYIPANPPSPIELLQGITLQPLHLVVRINPSTNSIQIGVARDEGIRIAMEKSPGLWNTKSTREVARMIPDTSKQREFLARHGGDTNIFKLSEFWRTKKR